MTGRRVIETDTAQEALSSVATEPPALIVLGVTDIDETHTLCSALRRFTVSPIIAVVGRYSEDEVATLLDAGADDVVTRRFRPREFIARIRAQLRRSPMPITQLSVDTIVTAGDLTLDLLRRSVTRNALDVHLTRVEWRLLGVLVAHAGRTLTYAQLFCAVWGKSVGDAEGYLRVHITHLRKKLEREPSRPQLIRTERSVGYRFETGTHSASAG